MHYINQLKQQVKPDDYYKFVDSIKMICNAEYQNRPKMIEHKN